MLGIFRLLHYQVTFVNVSLLASRPNTIILMVNRSVQVNVFSSVKKTSFANFTGRLWISSWRCCLTDSEIIWAGTCRKADSWRSRFTINWTDNRWTFSCSATFLLLLLVPGLPGWFSCKQISSPTCSIWIDLRLVFWCELIPFYWHVYREA